MFRLAEGEDIRDLDQTYAGMRATGESGRELALELQPGPRWQVQHAPRSGSPSPRTKKEFVRPLPCFGNAIVQGEREPIVAWFFEGFTTFYTRRLMYRMGLLDLQGYTADLNRALARYFASPARNAPSSRIVPAFFEDAELGYQPYLRGDFIALMTDADIRRKSGGKRTLDDVVKEMVAQGRTGVRETTASLFARLERETSRPRSEEFRRTALDGATIELPSDIFGPCLKLDRAASQPRFVIADARTCPARL